MRSKIVILSAFLSPFRSGAEACAEEVALHLSDRYDITIVTARLRRDLPKKDVLGGRVSVRRVGVGVGFDKWLFPFLAPLICRGIAPPFDSAHGLRRCYAPTDRPVLIHAVLETFAGLALYFCQWIVPGAKRLLTLQTLNRRFLKGPIVRSAHAVTAISHALAESAASLGREDVTVIPNGIPLDRIDDACRHTERVPGRILFVGRLERMKGVDVLLQAFARVVEVCHGMPLHLRIVGDGSLRSQLTAHSSQLGIAEHVIFAGYIPVPEVYREFAEAEVFCGLSRSEALGNVFLEAQAAGCAVVATRVGGIPEIVEDGVTGILVPPDDATAARSALGRLLKDAGFRRLLADRARAGARAYDWAVIAERYAEVYEALIER